MATTKPYHIRLTPTGSFFFGGERSLAGTGNDSYYVESRAFPQQTSILGMLRYQLLAAHSLMKEAHQGKKLEDNNKAATTLIGDAGFRHDKENQFGKIVGLSPVMLFNDKSYYSPMLATANLPFENADNGRMCSVFEAQVRDFIPALKGFKPKDPPEEMLYGSNKGTPVLFDEVFKKKTRIGISKNKKHFPWLYQQAKNDTTEASEMEGFFKQTSYYFDDKDWSFACIAWIEETAGDKLIRFLESSPLVTLGAERTLFHCKAKKQDTLPDMAPAFPALEKNLVRLVLLSDTWASPEALYDKCLFAISEAQEFRFLQSEVNNTDHYYRRVDKGDAKGLLTRSALLHLFKRGSVFFCTEQQAQDLANVLTAPAIKGKDNYRRIGYNAFAEVRSTVQTNFFKP